MARYFFICTLIFMAALSRLLPHPPNMVPVTAVALFAGVYLGKKWSFVIPLAAMLISDSVIGFHRGIPAVYASLLGISLIGIWLGRRQGFLTTLGATLAG